MGEVTFDCYCKMGTEQIEPDYVTAITDPNHTKHDELLEWNGPFDPEKFDATQASRRMKKGLPAS